MIKFIRWMFTIFGIIELFAGILMIIQGNIVSIFQIIVIFGAGVIFSFLGYIPQKIYKRYQEKEFLKGEQNIKENKKY